MFKLRDYQKETVDVIRERGKGIRTLIALPTGCHSKGTKILMYDGKYKFVEDIVVGDILMGVNSTPRTVLELHHGFDEMYKIIPNKGQEFVVNKGHILSLKKTNERSKTSERVYPSTLGGNIANISVEEYLNTSKYFKHIHKLYRTPVEFERKEGSTLLLHPYLLGLLLGDGSFTNNRVLITTADWEIKEEIYRFAKMYGLEVREETQNNNNSNNYYFKTKDGKRSKKNTNYIKNALIDLGLYNKTCEGKFIPYKYKTASVEDRLQLLAGLIDTDGYCDPKGVFSYCTKSQNLRDDIIFLARSLGFYVSYYEKNVRGGIYYNLTISGDCSIIPTKIERKKASERGQKKSVLVTGFKVEPVGEGEYFGFTVDGDNLYLLEDFTVTHNSGKTVIFSQVAVSAEGRVLIVVPSNEIREQTIAKLKAWDKNLDVGSVQAKLDEVASKIIVATRQSLTHGKSTRMERMLQHGEFEIIVIDEVHQAVEQIEKIVEVANNEDTKLVGFTATPYNHSLKKIFNSIAYQKTIYDMIMQGYLCEPRALGIKTNTSLAKVRTTLGDFNQRQLEDTVNNEERNDLIVRSYKEFASDRKSTLVFCVGIEHSMEVAEEFNKQGIKCKTIDSKLDSYDRQSIIEEFKRGELPVLCNVGVLTTGFDHPPVDCIIMAKPTKSRTLYEQILGRGLRPSEGKKDCLILDIVDTTRQHDLMSISDVFGFNIEDNETVTEAKKNREKEEEEEKEKKRREFEERERKRQEEERIIAEQIDLFNKNLARAFDEAYYDWFKVAEDMYCLSRTSSEHYLIRKNKRMWFDIYTVNTEKSKQLVSYEETFTNINGAMERVENLYIRVHNSYTYKDSRTNTWKSHNATENQLKYVPFKQGTKWDVHRYFTASAIKRLMKDVVKK